MRSLSEQRLEKARLPNHRLQGAGPNLLSRIMLGNVDEANRAVDDTAIAAMACGSVAKEHKRCCSMIAMNSRKVHLTRGN
jgi:hypothetical protein